MIRLSKMKILIAITTCWAYPERAALQRKLWTHRVRGADCKFFYGRGSKRTLLPDEIVLDCGDGYSDLTTKARAIYTWAYERNYDYVFDIDDDSYLIPERLLASDFYNYEYVGRTDANALNKSGYASGGPGVWIGRKSLDILVAAPPTDDTVDDRWLGNVLREHGILCHPDRRYCLSREWLRDPKTLISCCSEKEIPVDLNYVHQVCLPNGPNR